MRKGSTSGLQNWSLRTRDSRLNCVTPSRGPQGRAVRQPLFMRVLLWSGRSQSSDDHQAFRPGQPSNFEGRLRASASRSPSCPRRGGWSSSRRTVTYADVMVVVDTIPSASPDFFALRLHPHFASNGEMPARPALRMAWPLCTRSGQVMGQSGMVD